MLQAKGLQNIRFSDRIMEPKYIELVLLKCMNSVWNT